MGVSRDTASMRYDLVRVQLNDSRSEVRPRGLPRRPVGLAQDGSSLNGVRGPAQAFSPAPLHGCGSSARAAKCKVR